MLRTNSCTQPIIRVYTLMENFIKLPPQLAALTLSKVCNVASLPERPREKKCFPIYAEKQVINPKDTPVEWLMEAHNQAVYGNIPVPEKLARGALLGFFASRGKYPEEPSIWSKGMEGEICHVCYACILNHPIYLPEDVLRDLNEHILYDLPSYEVNEKCQPWIIYNSLELPVRRELFDIIPNLGMLTLDLCGDLKKMVLDENGQLVKFKTLHLKCGNLSKSVRFCGEIFTETDANGNPVLYQTVNDYVEKVTRRRLRLFL